MFTWSSPVFLRPPPGWLVLLLTTVCPAPLRFSKDLKVFHHRPRHCFHSDSPALSRQPGRRVVERRGGKVGGGGFVSSGNTVFSLFLTLGDKQGCWKLMGNQMLLFGCFLLFMWWLQSGVELQLRSATVTHMHTIRRQFACVFIFFSVCFIYFGNWDLSAAQGSSIPHTVFCQNRYF